MTNQNILRIETKKCIILRFVEELAHLYQYNPIILHRGINLQKIFLKHWLYHKIGRFLVDQGHLMGNDVKYTLSCILHWFIYLFHIIICELHIE
jgi:hypothetical protein